MLKALIFDMDGVLTDNAAMHIRAFEIFLQRHDAKTQLTSDMFGRTNEVIMSMLLPEEVAEKCWRTLADEKEELYRTMFRDELRPVAGLAELLEACRRESIKCAIGSSACRENVEFIIGLFGIGKYIDAWCCEDDVRIGKPDPEVYLKCCSRLGFAPSECVVFEDALAGITAGNRAGCKVVALTTSNPRGPLEASQADLVVDDFRGITLDRLRGLVG